ncbi:MAG: metallophosphoesterase, partial [Clostridia bacterium]|nr:metallophosphoesterase [Clostridia bacterium]
MNNNFKKIISLFIVTLFVLLSGCGDNTQNDTQSDAQKNTAAKLNPEDADGKFSLAIFPDTQQEVISYAAKNGNFLKRCEWLAENAKSFDVRFLVHTGDVVNWGDADESQLVLASDGMAVIDEANIPVIYSLGNHDTAA